MKSIRLGGVLALACVSAGLALASPTKDDAVAIVESAASFASKNGTDKLIAEVNKKGGTFHKGELYVFVFDDKGTLLANPAAQPLIGKVLIDQPDADGKLFRKEFIEVAQQKGAGWVDYKYKNPVNGAVEAKTSYVKKQGDLIIGAGVYSK